MIEDMQVRSPPSQRWQPTKAASCMVLHAPPIDSIFLQFRRVCWSLLEVYQVRELPKRVARPNQYGPHRVALISIIDSDRLRARARKLPTQFPHSREFWPAMTQVQQKAACNAGARYTKPDVRCAWDDLAGPDLPLTPELIAQMMGGRRTSVTEVAGDMPRRELSSSARGRFHIWINRVHEQARECHAAIGRMRI
jgi:hypothetical protein